MSARRHAARQPLWRLAATVTCLAAFTACGRDPAPPSTDEIVGCLRDAGASTVR